MRHFCLFLIVLCCLFALQPAAARDYVVALSPYMDPDSARSQVVGVLQFLTSLEPGDEAVVLDGYNVVELGRFTIPEGRAYANPKARLGVNRAAVNALMQFADTARPAGGNNAPSTRDALRVPQLLRHIGQTGATDHSREVIILGSAFYDDPAEPAFSMASGLVPGDGHLFHSRAKTPFGTADNPDLLKNVRIHFAYTDEMESDRHQFFVQRFTNLYVEQLGGHLVSFTPDRTSAFRRATTSAPVPAHSYELAESDKLEMIRLPEPTIRRSIYDRPVSAAPLPADTVRYASDVQIGISWDNCERCDLDLYAQAHPGAQVLYFGHTVSPEGRYWKDYRESPQSTRGRETIGFTVPLDLRTLRIAVNFYQGNAPEGVRGEIRLAVADRTYAMTYHLPATSGNKGSGVRRLLDAGQADTPHTILIDPLHLIGLSDTPG